MDDTSTVTSSSVDENNNPDLNEEAHEGGEEEIKLGATCDEVDADYEAFAMCVKVEKCNFCKAVDDDLLAITNLLPSDLRCPLRLCTLPPTGNKPPCSTEDIDDIVTCQESNGVEPAIFTHKSACKMLADVDACVNDASCDACSYATVYEAGLVEVWNLEAAAVNCDGERMCGQGQGNKAYKSFALSEPTHASEGEEGEEGDGGFNTKALTLVILSVSAFAILVAYCKTRRGSGGAGWHRQIDSGVEEDEDDFHMNGEESLGGLGGGGQRMKKMQVGNRTSIV